MLHIIAAQEFTLSRHASGARLTEIRIQQQHGTSLLTAHIGTTAQRAPHMRACIRQLDSRNSLTR